jgi:hypothetical protein
MQSLVGKPVRRCEALLAVASSPELAARLVECPLSKKARLIMAPEPPFT